MGRHGGGAFSGKDPSKVDRSAAYAARWVAKNVVAAGLASRCEVQLSYAIGVAKPLSVRVDTFGTAKVSEDAISAAIDQVFDLTPAGIIGALGLKAPIFLQTAAHGHFGRPGFPWEETSKVAALKDATAAMPERVRRPGGDLSLAPALLPAPTDSPDEDHAPPEVPGPQGRLHAHRDPDVILIIGVLMTFVIPNVVSSIGQGKSTACRSSMEQIKRGFLEYESKYSKIPSQSGVGFFASLITDKVWRPTVKNTRRSPARGAAELPDPRDGRDPHRGLVRHREPRDIDGGWSSYAVTSGGTRCGASAGAARPARGGRQRPRGQPRHDHQRALGRPLGARPRADRRAAGGAPTRARRSSSSPSGGLPGRGAADALPEQVTPRPGAPGGPGLDSRRAGAAKSARRVGRRARTLR